MCGGEGVVGTGFGCSQDAHVAYGELFLRCFGKHSFFASLYVFMFVARWRNRESVNGG